MTPLLCGGRAVSGTGVSLWGQGMSEAGGAVTQYWEHNSVMVSVRDRLVTERMCVLSEW